MSLTSYFQTDETAYNLAERIRWPVKPVCPHCDTMGSSGKLRGASTHPATWKCYECRRPFNVRLHSFFEGSHAPLHVWFQLIYILLLHDMKLSTGCIERTLIITYKMARHMKEAIIEHNSIYFKNSDNRYYSDENQISHIFDYKFAQEQADGVTWHSNSITQLRFLQFKEMIANNSRRNLDGLFLSKIINFLSPSHSQKWDRNMQIKSLKIQHEIFAPS